MEGSAFTQELDAHDGDAPTDELDPFGQDGMGDFQQGDDPLAAAEAEPTEDLPIVNAEGELVEPDAAATQVPPAAVGTDGLPNPRLNPVSQREQAVAAVAEQAAVAEEGGASVDPPPAAQETQAQGQEVSPAAQDAAAPAASDSSSSPTPASATAGQAEDAPPSDAPSQAPPSDDAEVPDATKTHRRYLLFAPNGDGTFTEVSWRENKDGEMVTSGGKKQTVCLARGQEDALAWGWRALGAPDEGCSLVAVAAGYFQVRHVGPDREPPKHPRLKIK